MLNLELTEYIAIYGGILATVNGAWNYLNWRRGNKKMQISATLVAPVIGHDHFTQESNDPHKITDLRIDITNESSHPVTISMIKAEMKGTKAPIILYFPELPKMMSPGEAITLTNPAFVKILPNLRSPIMNLNVFDTTNRCWKIKKIEVNKINNLWKHWHKA